MFFFIQRIQEEKIDKAHALTVQYYMHIHETGNTFDLNLKKALRTAFLLQKETLLVLKQGKRILGF